MGKEAVEYSYNILHSSQKETADIPNYTDDSVTYEATYEGVCCSVLVLGNLHHRQMIREGTDWEEAQGEHTGSSEYFIPRSENESIDVFSRFVADEMAQ